MFGDSVRVPGPGEKISHVMLLYAGLKGAKWAVSRWFAPIGEDGLPATEERLLKLAQADASGEPEFQGYGFENISFVEYMCYFTIVLDADGYDFHDGKDTDPMLFMEKKENSSLPPPPAPVVPNKSFYDLEKTKVGTLPALRCRNYMRNGVTGEPLKEGETQGFIFNIYVHAEYAHKSATGVVLIIDPDGTSTGPRK